ncbi:hypothetical protein C8J56DRAFT_1062102 [Mycena floridula]|nr:hypothetical protein C8J56DRAFT_1062102 [Mycena floridula]
MDKAKYTFHIEAGGTDIQQTAFNDGYQHIDSFQNRCAKSDMHDDHLVDGRLRFTKNVFSPLAGAPINPAMQTWMGPERVQHAVDALKGTHQVHSLLVYDIDGSVIQPINIRDAMEGSLVEVIYNLKHWYIESARKDSFTADIVSVRILREESASVRETSLDEDDASSATLSVEASNGNASSGSSGACGGLREVDKDKIIDSTVDYAVGTPEKASRKRCGNSEGGSGNSKKVKTDL